jgi:hypothetical protein
MRAPSGVVARAPTAACDPAASVSKPALGRARGPRQPTRLHQPRQPHPPPHLLRQTRLPLPSRPAHNGPYWQWTRKVAGRTITRRLDATQAAHYAEWLYEDRLEARGHITVVRDARYVVDGNLVTSQGVTGGIDLALWLIGRLHGRDHARAVRRHLQYDPAPPYLADEPLAHVAG